MINHHAAHHQSTMQQAMEQPIPPSCSQPWLSPGPLPAWWPGARARFRNARKVKDMQIMASNGRFLDFRRSSLSPNHKAPVTGGSGQWVYRKWLTMFYN